MAKTYWIGFFISLSCK